MYVYVLQNAWLVFFLLVLPLFPLRLVLVVSNYAF